MKPWQKKWKKIWQKKQEQVVDDKPDTDHFLDAHGDQGEYGDLRFTPRQLPFFVERFGLDADKMKVDPNAGKEEEGRGIPDYVGFWDYLTNEGKIRIPYFIDKTVPEEYHQGIHDALAEFPRAVPCLEFYLDADLHHWHGIHVFGSDDGEVDPGCWSYVGRARNAGATWYAALGLRHGWQALRLPNWCVGVGGVFSPPTHSFPVPVVYTKCEKAFHKIWVQHL